MKYIVSQNKKDLYRCLGVHKSIDEDKYGKREKEYRIEVTHGYGEEQFYHTLAKYSSEENMNIVYDDIIHFLRGNNKIFELPKDEEVKPSNYEVCMI